MAAEGTRLVLDVTRLAARVGRPVLTGIDRVERAYLEAFLDRDPALCCLVGTRAGQILLPSRAGHLLLDWLADPARAPRPGPFLAGLARGRARRLAVLAALWPLRVAPVVRAAHVPRAIAARPGSAAAWLVNVGHLNPAPVAARSPAPTPGGPGLRRAILLHDTIPLDHGHVAEARAFRPLLQAARAADLVLCPSAAAAADLLRHAPGSRSPVVVAPGIGPAVPVPRPAPSPHGPPCPADLVLPPGAPLFLCLGTLAPRKDQAFLLDLWQALAADPPPGPMPWLVLAGRVAAGGAAAAARAARMAAAGLPVRHRADLDDAAVAALMGRARALLQPSRAEGFGLPAVEAAARGLPVLALPLPATREVLGDYPVYLAPGAAYPWLAAIRQLCAAPSPRRPRPPPGWGGHFARVFDAMRDAER